MGMTKEIVVGVDASDSGLAAVRWAADVAAARQAPLRLVTILPRWAYEMPDDGRYAEVGQWAREDAGNVIARARSAASDGHPGLEIDTEVLPGDVKTVLVDRVEKAALAVVGTRGSGGFLDLLVGSVALTVAARAACPTVVVRRWEPTAPHDRVLVAVDVAQPDPVVLDAAAEEAHRRGAVLWLVSAVRGARDIVAGRAERLSDEDAWYLEQGDEGPRQVLAGLVQDLGSRYEGLEVDGEVRAGHPVSVLQDASGEADLLAIGRRHLRSRTPLGLGSITRGLLAQSQCPVMVVPVRDPDR